MPPLVSVVLPFYKDQETVGAAVESVLSQTMSDLELIAVDDGSPDGSVEIVSELARSDDRIRLVRQENGGLSAARNAGLRAARGRFCAFLDADDLWLPHKLERQLPLLDARTLVFSDAWCEEDGRRSPWCAHVDRNRSIYPRGEVYDELFARNFICASSVVLSMELVREASGFDESLRSLEDWDLWLRLARAGVSFDYAHEPLVMCRIRPGSLSRDSVEMRVAAARLLALHAPHVLPEGRGVLRQRVRGARKDLEVALRKRAWGAVLAGQMHAARPDLVRSLLVRPYSPRAWLALSLTVCPPLARRLVQARV